LCFEVRTNGVRRTSLPDTAGLQPQPNAEVNLRLDLNSTVPLSGAIYRVPSAYDSENEDYVAIIYYMAHEGLDENVIEIGEREDNVFQVRWTGTTIDVNCYDGSKPRTRVEILAGFTLVAPES